MSVVFLVSESFSPLQQQRAWRRHFDVETAFLYGQCDEEIYIQPSNGVNFAEGNILGLHKCLYGLKQASGVWHYAASTALRNLGLKENDAEACISQHADPNDTYMLIQMHVDDLEVVEAKQAAVNAFF